MSAFARALASLHADPNLSVACGWAYGWDRAAPRTLVADLELLTVTLSIEPVAVRGIRGEPIDRTGALIGGGGVAPRDTLDIPVASLPADVMRRDLITIGGESYTVETPERDIEALTWRLILAKA
jgi:hypothetical protein